MSKKTDHYYEACYQIWRNGCDPDRLNPDDSDYDYDNGNEPEHTSDREIKRQECERIYRI